MNFITKEELESPRKAHEIRKWVEKKIRTIGSTKEGRRAIRFRKGLLKKLIEESSPLGIFCDRYFKDRDDVTLVHNIGSQNYDAKITSEAANDIPFRYLEITQAHEGEDFYLRMLKLDKDGCVNALGSVTKKGTKNTGIIVEVSDEAVEHGVVLDRELHRIKEAARRKSKKRYPSATALIIVCEDSIVFEDKGDLDALFVFMQDEVLPMLGNVDKVFLIGWSSKLFLELK